MSNTSKQQSIRQKHEKEIKENCPNDNTFLSGLCLKMIEEEMENSYYLNLAELLLK